MKCNTTLLVYITKWILRISEAFEYNKFQVNCHFIGSFCRIIGLRTGNIPVSENTFQCQVACVVFDANDFGIEKYRKLQRNLYAVREVGLFYCIYNYTIV